MKLLLISVLVLHAACAQAWGFYGHRKINELAVFTLPPEMFGFYKIHLAFIRDHAVDADKRRYAVAEEACRHFLDGDHYEHALPIDTIPFTWKEAVEKYGEDSIQAHGIVPWHVQVVLFRLTEAFKAKDTYRILRLSADLGHYIADCHVPLHATGNYNGQRTGQDGIHGLWESRLPELFESDYDLLTGRAAYVEHPLLQSWAAFAGSFGLVDSVLKTEQLLSASFPADEKYAFEMRGNSLVKVYSETFSRAYHEKLGNMVEDRMRAAIAMLGNFWYTAWINAGQPDLSSLPEPVQPDTDKQKDAAAEAAFSKGAIIGRKEE